ncbi:RagB/SusD family nutrient uptake outer membrane protein [Maribellus luteus]|nr:RagB/SusD family nutrient uptake outer membrane protein [Maribellus luteus]
MKFIYKSIYLIALTLLLFAGSCTDLEVPVESELTAVNFPNTEEDFIAIAGPAYRFLHYKFYTINQILVQELTGDMAILTANGGNWYDDGRYQNYHLHTPTPDQRFLRESWAAWYNGVSKINSILPLFEGKEESEVRDLAIAELRAFRAYLYFILQDNWGGVPIVTDFGPEVELKGRDSRKDVCKFIEDELLEVLPNLSGETGVATYARMTQWAAYALLAKLYMNWEVYTGEAGRWNDAVTACDKIIAEAQTNGTIALDPDYLAMFYPDNGPQIKDFLFAIPCDGVHMQEHIPARYWLHRGLRYKYELPFNPSGSVKALPEYYDKFVVWNDNDVRKGIWLTGKQYMFDGSPIIIETTNSGLDDRYNGPNPNAPVDYHLEFTREIEFRNLVTFDTGNDELGKAVGYRCNKFYPDKNSITRNQNNDLPIFRYADILLLKAEAILRGANATMGHTPVSLANMVRTRAKAMPYTTLDLDELLDERARELAYEGWRRNDLIRFGKFEEPWGVKTSTDVRKRIFPIPQEQIDRNPLLEQNPSYE